MYCICPMAPSWMTLENFSRSNPETICCLLWETIPREILTLVKVCTVQDVSCYFSSSYPLTYLVVRQNKYLARKNTICIVGDLRKMHLNILTATSFVDIVLKSSNSYSCSNSIDSLTLAVSFNLCCICVGSKYTTVSRFYLFFVHQQHHRVALPYLSVECHWE